MPQFFISKEAIWGGIAEVTGEDFRHLVQVRRVKTGRVLYLADDSGTCYYGTVTDITASSVRVKITGSYMRSAPGLDICLYLCLLKGGNFEYAIRKSVEVGINRLVPVISARTVPEPDKKIEQKAERWNRIASEASKQCMRPGTVSVGLPVEFEDIIDADSSEVKIIGHPGAGRNIRDYLRETGKPRTISLLVGPEGGFSPGEVDEAVKNGWEALSFGFTHLRAETAAAVIPALVIYEWGAGEDPVKE